MGLYHIENAAGDALLGTDALWQPRNCHRGVPLLEVPLDGALAVCEHWAFFGEPGCRPVPAAPATKETT